jgi:hypothetical protein
MKRGKKRNPLVEADPWSLLPTSLPEGVFRTHLESCKTSFDILMTYYKHGHQKKLTNKQRALCWKLVNDFITHCELGHFAMWQLSSEHDIRVMAYYEWQMLMKHKSAKYCRYVFQTAFADFLAVLQCREYGIALLHNNDLLNVKTKFIKYFKYYFMAQRKEMSIPEFIITHEKCEQLHQDIVTEYEFYFEMVRQALEACPSAVYYGCHNLKRKAFETAF